MTSGFGVDKGADGSGTSASDIRKIFGGLYTPGLISGGGVSRSGSSMTYSVNSGVAAIETATGEVVLAPIPSKTITAATNGSSPRTDYVYAKQRYPSIEGDADIDVDYGSSLPSRSVLLAKFNVPANAGNTNAATNAGGVDYSIPYGASLGVLHKYTDTSVGNLATGLTRKGNGSIWVPTDRRLRFSLTTTLQANGATGFDNTKYCEWGFIPSIDGSDFILWSTPGLHQALATYYYEAYITVSKGSHTVNYGALRLIGPGTAYHFAGLIGSYGRVGTIFQVEDAGPVV